MAVRKGSDGIFFCGLCWENKSPVLGEEFCVDNCCEQGKMKRERRV